jgi:hypothetical protein
MKRYFSSRRSGDTKKNISKVVTAKTRARKRVGQSCIAGRRRNQLATAQPAANAARATGRMASGAVKNGASARQLAGRSPDKSP